RQGPTGRDRRLVRWLHDGLAGGSHGALPGRRVAAWLLQLLVVLWHVRHRPLVRRLRLRRTGLRARGVVPRAVATHVRGADAHAAAADPQRTGPALSDRAGRAVVRSPAADGQHRSRDGSLPRGEPQPLPQRPPRPPHRAPRADSQLVQPVSPLAQVAQLTSFFVVASLRARSPGLLALDPAYGPLFGP